MKQAKPARAIGILAIATAIAVGVAIERPVPAAATKERPALPIPPGLEKIDHLIFIVQENRSFDHYFGTYESPSGEPVNGIPRNPDGSFAVCVPNPVSKRCDKPFHSTNPFNLGGPHSHRAARRDINGGAMDGFIETAMSSPRAGRCIHEPRSRRCRGLVGPKGQPDLMSYHTREEIPNYWAYADWGVLQDHMFSPVDSYTLPAHLYLTSAWAATCRDPQDVMTCTSDPRVKKGYIYPWTDITYLLEANGVSWKYYVGDATDLGCGAGDPCENKGRPGVTPIGWMPVRWFTTVKENDQTHLVQHTADFFKDVDNGTLPSVVWLVPSARNSEHPGKGPLTPGHRYVTEVVNTIASSHYWWMSAIFITWDDWGGFYDHVRPPRADLMGYGLRVPGLMLSPYAKAAYVDHQILSFDAYLKLIEDRFLGGQRLDPLTDGRPDPRPTVRENVPFLGDLKDEFDFSQPPREPSGIILPPDT